MRRILLALVSILGISVCAHAQINQTATLTTGSKIGTVISEVGSGVNVHIVTWNTTGTVSACSVKVQQSADNITFSDLITSQTCTSSGGPTTSVTGVVNYIRVNATTLTGSGTLTVRYTGLTAGSVSTVAISGNVATTVADGSNVAIGTTTDNKCTTTDTTSCTLVGISKELSAALQSLVALAVTDPCTGLAKTVVPFLISSGTTTQLAAASAPNKLYVCSINIGPVSGAQNIALIEDDTAACASPTAGLVGGVTAANGWNIAANGGIALGNGSGTVAVTAAVNRYVCLISANSVTTPGVIAYVLAP